MLVSVAGVWVHPASAARLWAMIGGLLALVLVGVALLLLQTPVERLASSYGSDFTLTGPGAPAVLAVLLGGCTLGLLGAWGAVLRQLRTVEPA